MTATSPRRLRAGQDRREVSVEVSRVVHAVRRGVHRAPVGHDHQQPVRRDRGREASRPHGPVHGLAVQGLAVEVRPEQPGDLGTRPRQEWSASFSTRCRRSLSRPGCGGRPARRQSRSARPPFQAAGGEAEDLAVDAGRSRARARQSTSGRGLLLVGPHRSRAVEQEASPGPRRPARVVACGRSRASVGLVTSRDSRPLSTSPSSWAASHPTLAGASTRARSRRASRGDV